MLAKCCRRSMLKGWIVTILVCAALLYCKFSTQYCHDCTEYETTPHQSLILVVSRTMVCCSRQNIAIMGVAHY